MLQAKKMKLYSYHSVTVVLFCFHYFNVPGNCREGQLAFAEGLAEQLTSFTPKQMAIWVAFTVTAKIHKYYDTYLTRSDGEKCLGNDTVKPK